MKTRLIPLLLAIATLVLPCIAKDAVVLDLQKKLTSAGFDPKGVDGEWGKGTAAALKEWQTANSLTATGILEPGSETVSKLGLTLPDSSTPVEITKLLSAGRLEARTEGVDIRSVSVLLRSKVPYPINVAIPVGTYFVCGGGGAQNMVGTGGRTLTLTGGGQSTVSVSAACANRERAIPNSNNRFSIKSTDAQRELAVVMTVLDEAAVDYPVIQAAVWIITGNADYNDLGILVSRRAGQFGGGTRVIGSTDAARAMQLIEKAGIRISGKSIWADRKTIAKELDDGELKQFLLRNR